MNKKISVVLVILAFLTFIAFIIYDVAFHKEKAPVGTIISDSSKIEDQWYIADKFEPHQGNLKTIATSTGSSVFIGGDKFVARYQSDLKPVWALPTKKTVTAIALSGDTVFASTYESILVISPEGKLITEWGPFEDSSVIVSVAANKSLVAFSDAQHKIITIIDKKGNMLKQIGFSGEPFIIPNNYFEVDLTKENMIYVANSGKNRIELRNLEGTIAESFGAPGNAPGDFCGCCNPSHFARIPEGFITSEKGINRIKILDRHGVFVEYVNSVNKFTPSVPLDVASPDGKIIYAVNPSDSKLYVFKRKG